MVTNNIIYVIVNEPTYNNVTLLSTYVYIHINVYNNII